MNRWYGLVLLVFCAATLPAVDDPYLGCPPPGAEARLFAPGIVSTGLVERDLTVSPDGCEICWAVSTPGAARAAIVCSRWRGGRWTAPEVLPGLDDPAVRSLEPAFSPDGGRLFFTRVPPDAEGGFSRADIWVMDRIAEGWGAPRSLGSPVNSDGGEFFPSLTRDGTLYFTREPKNGKDAGIYRARRQGDRYLEPEWLPLAVNSGAARFNAFVDPDERYLIVPVQGGAGSRGGVDYYVVLRGADDHWSEPVNLGPLVNTAGSGEYSASVSPDGRYLFFMSSRPAVAGPARLSYRSLQELATRPGNGNADVFWTAWPPLLAQAKAALAVPDSGAGFPAALAGLKPDGFGPAGRVMVYGTSERPGPDGNIYQFIDGGGVVYEKHGYVSVRHAEFTDAGGHTVRFDVYRFADEAGARAALADEAICPPGATPWPPAPEGRTTRFPPDYSIYVRCGRQLVFLHVDDDRQAAVLDRFALAVRDALNEEEP